jgi:hydroxymethylbilane synthase
MLIRLGTRQSALALWQADYVSAALRSLGHEVQLVKIITSGDVSTTPLGESGGQGVFTKEIQRALLDNRCDLAVHSLKDLPTEVIPELCLVAVPPREDTSDCLLSKGMQLAELPLGASIGTGSPRRKASLLNTRPDLLVKDIRGNVDTRIRKLDEGLYDAIVLAFAGLHRLGLESRITQKFSSDEMLPAVGQAALGLETRADDADTILAVSQLDDLRTHAAVIAERTLLRSMRAGCLAPLACNAIVKPNSLQILARVFSPDGKTKIETKHAVEHHLDFVNLDHKSELILMAEQLGREVAKRLTEQGAAELIHQAHV